MAATDAAAVRAEIEAKSHQVEKELREQVADRAKLSVVKAPPGSGKTRLLLKSAEFAFKQKRRVAIATQTNSQADDICKRIAAEHPSVTAIRFAGQGHVEQTFGKNVAWETAAKNLPHAPCIVVGTSAKWGLVQILEPFDLLFVEEAWQLSWADFMLLAQVAERFVLIGDPGQIPPVVTIDVSRWETSPRPPHRAAPQVIIEDPRYRHQVKPLELPATRRLPKDSAELVKRFYDFDFEAWALDGDRAIAVGKAARSGVDRVVDLLSAGSASALTIPTPDGGPPMDVDEQLAAVAADLASRIFARDAVAKIDGKAYRLGPEHVGMVSTHRMMNAALEDALPAKLRGKLRVDTPERWQGLELPLMIVVHPLSGVVHPSTFDLETGRLCVMASRHKAGMIVVSRDHVGDTLRGFISSADQPVGRPDVAGRGHVDNLGFWEALEQQGRVITG